MDGIHGGTIGGRGADGNARSGCARVVYHQAVRLALLLLTLPLWGQTIDAGSSTDQYFIGGTAWLISPPGTGDATLRFGSFRYKIHAEGPQVLTLRFREPTVTGPGQRVFSVHANHQPIISRLDLVADGAQDRSYVVVPSGGYVELRFETHIRSAVVSSITLAPLLLGRITHAGQSVALTQRVSGEIQMLEYSPEARKRFDAPALILLYSGFPSSALRTTCPGRCPLIEGHTSEPSAKTWRVSGGVILK